MNFVLIKYTAPFGGLDLHFSETALTGLYFSEGNNPQRSAEHITAHSVVGAATCRPPIANHLVELTIRELDEYFAGTRRIFTIPLEPHGTDFRKSVWERLLHVPFGETKSYMDIAREIGNPKAPRAVGGAVGKNPISIIIPCHRIIGTNRSLTGFGGGIPIKKWLLTHEGISYK